MGEYDRTGKGQNGEADWDLRSILCDMAKNWWIILLIACSAAMITYTVLTAVHRDQYTVKTTFAVMGRGENVNAASSLSATYEMTQKFQAILENNILKKKVIHDTVQEEIKRYDIKTAGDKSPVSLMSGGNQQKLLVAREIGGDPVLLIAVYPSRGLDIGAAEAIHEILLEQCRKGVAVLLISEELDELFQMSDRIGVLCSGEMMAVIDRKEADYDTIGRLMSGEHYEK